jgi:DNA-binding NarL/FixJ family response regulator
MKSIKAIRIVMIDDHHLFALAIKSLFTEADGIRVVGITASADEAEQLVAAEQPEVLITDLSMPDINGIELCKRLLRLFPELSVLCLTMHREQHFIRKMIDAGVKGYVLKTADKEELVRAVAAIARGEQYFSPEVAAALLQPSFKQQPSQQEGKYPHELLSKRELEIALLIARELTTQEIADKLFISARTVESHRTHLMEKIGARNTAGIVKFVVEYGLLE